MRDITFELCAETLSACLAARDGGADRVELCSNLSVGGLTPSSDLVRDAITQTGLPIHAMVRPRAGNFVYTTDEFTAMQQTIRNMKDMGAAGVVFGLLHPGNTVDIERTRTLVVLADPMQVTFHRAFDETPSLPQTLEDVLATGCHRILTSGGQPDVLTGATMLARLVAQSSGRIILAVGGGLRLDNAAEVSRRTQATQFHGSLRRTLSPETYTVLADDVRSMLKILRNT